MGTEELYFSGGGEPFTHPDILEILRYAKDKGLRCSVNTNFTLVDETIVRRLVEMGLDGLTVSVWAGTAKTYAATHPNKDEAAFYRLRSLLRMLNTMRLGGKPFVKVYHVVSSLNYDEIAPMVAFGRETESDAVEFTVIDTIPGATDALTLTPEQRRFVLEQCEAVKSGDHGVKVLSLEHFTRRLADPGADFAQYDSQFIETIPCCIGWLFSRIMPNGDVNFCLKAHRIPVGNLYERSFKDIWNSHEQMLCRRKALTATKDDPFFKSIGNDPDCPVGCRKSCDDLGRIIALHNRMNELSAFERNMLNALVKSL
jgi:MoaA/NifB/PqqE/SkfB family radical SAM enzyme